MRQGVNKYKAVRELERHVAIRWRSLFAIYSRASSAYTLLSTPPQPFLDATITIFSST